MRTIPLVKVGAVIKFYGWWSEVLAIKTQDGEYDYLLKPLDDVSFCSGRECNEYGCADCEYGKYRSNWFLGQEFEQGFKNETP